MDKVVELNLSISVMEKLGYYVYLLVNPFTNKVFYVGKGVNDRIIQHVKGSLSEKNNGNIMSNKISEIKDINSKGKQVIHYILRHGLDETTAFHLEAGLIDYFNKFEDLKITNIMGGHHSFEKGIMKLEDIKAKYDAKPIIPRDNLILININNMFEKVKEDSNSLYEATRKHWKINLFRVKKIKYACAVYKGIIREVYIINKWLNSNESNKGRKYFVGRIADDEIRNQYLFTDVSKYWSKGSQNPIKYIEI